MTLPIVPGKRIVGSERGWFAPPFTACRFAEIAKQARAQGYDVPLARQPEGVDNFVRDLQIAGDNTPGNGSTMRQGQKAIRALLPDARFQFGTISDAELFDFVTRGATVSFAVDCGKLPRYLKRFVGYGFNGGHYMGVDGVYGSLESFDIDLSDAMYRPAREAKPRRVPWDHVRSAVLRSGGGDIFVTMSWVNSAFLEAQLAAAQVALASAEVVLVEAETVVAANQAAVDVLAEQLAALAP